ncbi:MAG: MATE family efflux transporter [Bacteroidetes bacterium]|nr:MATE family efflux transporter [Bacteroidota bacterium]MBT6836531.1 MATE family efflux transporter [Bacteroidota bacterium]MBT7039690.1 MATE family efflux transporter [Bacteroidota bacterium]MBT7827310.1 MATE family efflux transporter [Bacteroidota bacterium]MBT7995741.1 MATE family efflux transporter [Bacteroidota bacterium]
MEVNTTYKSIFRISLPIIIGGMAQTAINVIDTAFLGRLNEITLGAAAIGGIFYLIFTLLCMGMAIGVQIIIARRTGENKSKDVGIVFDQGLYLMGLFSILLFLLMYFAGPQLMKQILTSDLVYEEVIRYLRIRNFGIFFVGMNMAYRALYVGLSKTNVLTYSTAFMAVVNIFLDYVLIFGNWGFPNMGIQGAALASVIAEVSAMVYFIIFTKIRLDLNSLSLYRFRKLSKDIIGSIVNLSYPSVFQNLISIGTWFMFFVIIEKTGERQLAISNVLRSNLMIFMLPVWGLATTANTMASNIIGQGKSGEVLKLSGRIIVISYIWTLLFLPLVLFEPQWLLSVITNDTSIVSEAIAPLRVIYSALFIFVPGVVLLHTVTGTGDTRTAFFIELASIAIYSVYVYNIAIVLGSSLEMVWTAEFVYWAIMAILSFIRLRGGKWKKIKV